MAAPDDPVSRYFFFWEKPWPYHDIFFWAKPGQGGRNTKNFFLGKPGTHDCKKIKDIPGSGGQKGDLALAFDSWLGLNSS